MTKIKHAQGWSYGRQVKARQASADASAELLVSSFIYLLYWILAVAVTMASIRYIML